LTESACQAALENLAVHEKEYRSHMTVEQRQLRNRLRARGRAAGDKRNDRTGAQEIGHLIELSAYEHWHRLLFTRFLTENHLLITDEANGSVPVTLEECEELAPELGARDGLDLACQFAGRTLPGVFRRDDPVLDLPLALNDQVELRKLLATLPSECFTSDDSLGWTYQFWQTQRKDEINDSGKKIGADELSPVTQLFTEDYMVEFLLHNTLGAWWAGKRGPITAGTEQEARARVALPSSNGIPAIAWTYLRFVLDEKSKTWIPAAGTFDGWPNSARDITLLDPCMGSGHFLVFALPLLVRLRMEEEKLAAQAAMSAVLNDNIHGLELDERCTQIAAFNLALTAWKLAGYQPLPPLHLACSGLAPRGTEAEWVALARDNDRLRRGMARLHRLFKDAPVLGSLINPRTQTGDLIEADYHELAPLLKAALERETKASDDAAEIAIVAQGIAKAAEILAGKFALVCTNVPYLKSGSQSEELRSLLSASYPVSKMDLATCFIERCCSLCCPRSSLAVVSPQSWLYQPTYKGLRHKLLREAEWNLLAKLGPRAFETIGGEVVNVCLLLLSTRRPDSHHTLKIADVSDVLTPLKKAGALVSLGLQRTSEMSQLKNPEYRISISGSEKQQLLSEYAATYEGLTTGDLDRFIQCFWEQAQKLNSWEWLIGISRDGVDYGGREQVLFWQGGTGQLTDSPGSYIKGAKAWGNQGLRISQTGSLIPTIYTGELFDKNGATLVPISSEFLAPIYCFCKSEAFNPAIRTIDQSLKVTIGTIVKIPFDLAYWQKVAADRYPNGLPKPYSSDPTQWLFNGHPKGSDQSLHVAVARLLGYRWPRQTGSRFPDCPALGADGLDKFADDDGIVCLAPLNREQPAAARLRQLLTAALGKFDERALIAKAGLKAARSKTIEDWLRNEFFEQHASLFHDRPFVWHLWDGRKDGFHVLVNYHKLDHATLQKLTYSYLGNWIQQQAEDTKADKPGAAERLGAARELQAKLAAILDGEAPLDIFARWKPIKKQASGWNPDINDGVRQNIRPFLLAGNVGKRGAGLFRAIPLRLKDKDRGEEPHRDKSDFPWFWSEKEPGIDPVGGNEFAGIRWNNVHLTLKRKQRAE
jgi:hypothetical protein